MASGPRDPSSSWVLFRPGFAQRVFTITDLFLEEQFRSHRHHQIVGTVFGMVMCCLVIRPSSFKLTFLVPEKATNN
jgi:hypothetical protein